jgi:hypothetical protein
VAINHYAVLVLLHDVTTYEVKQVEKILLVILEEGRILGQKPWVVSRMGKFGDMCQLQCPFSSSDVSVPNCTTEIF